MLSVAITLGAETTRVFDLKSEALIKASSSRLAPTSVPTDKLNPPALLLPMRARVFGRVTSFMSAPFAVRYACTPYRRSPVKVTS